MITDQVISVLQGVRLPILKKRRNLIKPHLKLYWWQPPDFSNFGDCVSRDIILNIFGYNCDYAPLDSCDLMAAGSILELAAAENRKHPAYVWGSGFIREDSDNEIGRVIFKSVRGKKTLSRIKKRKNKRKISS